jgi:hypothetical protein
MFIECEHFAFGILEVSELINTYLYCLVHAKINLQYPGALDFRVPLGPYTSYCTTCCLSKYLFAFGYY